MSDQIYTKHTVVSTPHGDVLVHQPGTRTHSANGRLSEASYRRYAHYFSTALNLWPSETSFDLIPGLSPNTMVGRLRDARIALREFGYDPDLQTKLRDAEDLVITLDADGKKIWFRHAHPRGRPRKAVTATPTTIHRPILHATETIRPLPPPDDLTAMCRLLSGRHIPGPLIFRGRVDPTLISTLETSFDIAFAYDSVTDITTLL